MSRRHRTKGAKPVKRGAEIGQLNVDCHKDVIAVFRSTADYRNMTQRYALEQALQAWCGLKPLAAANRLEDLL